MRQAGHDRLQVVVAFARVEVLFAWSEMNPQRLFLGSPILESACVRENVTRANHVKFGIAFEKSFGSVFGEWRVEIDDTLLTQLHDDVSENRLTHGRRFKHRAV